MRYLALRKTLVVIGKAMWDGTKEITDLATQRTSKDTYSPGQQVNRELGLYEWQVGAAQVTGVSEESFYVWRLLI